MRLGRFWQVRVTLLFGMAVFTAIMWALRGWTGFVIFAYVVTALLVVLETILFFLRRASDQDRQP